jgi:putative phosphoserine phosphatase / 1-acylglycerol-3-phosphate O-acyltransferase
MEITISNINHDSYNYAVFLDLDHTMIKKVSGKVLAIMAVRKGYVRPSILLKISFQYLLYKIRLINPQRMAEGMIKWTRGIPETTIIDLSDKTAEDELFPSIYSEALAEIEFHKQNHARIIILSASINHICKKIAARIGMDDIICTSLEVHNGYLTGNTNSMLCFGNEKSAKLREYCLNHNINISESWYYGDSMADLPVFHAVGLPVCINPGRKLRKTAMENDWKILTWSD